MTVGSNPFNKLRFALTGHVNGALSERVSWPTDIVISRAIGS
jgi:hypothetical protein